MIGHATGSQQWDLVLSPDFHNKRIESLLKSWRNQISSILCAVNHMNVVVGIGVAHAFWASEGTASYHSVRVSAAPPALEFPDQQRTQPFRDWAHVWPAGPPALSFFAEHGSWLSI